MHKDDVVHIYNGALLSHEKSEVLPFEATWIVDQEMIILSDVRMRKQILSYWDLKYDTNEPV